MVRTIPLIRLQGNLLVSIQIELSDRLVNELKDNICAEIQAYHPRGLIIEVSGVDILDSYIARSVRDMTQLAGLMGVHSVIAGLDPSMAVTLVEMGLSFAGVDTALNLDSALEKLEQAAVAEEDPEMLATGDAATELLEWVG